MAFLKNTLGCKHCLHPNMQSVYRLNIDNMLQVSGSNIIKLTPHTFCGEFLVPTDSIATVIFNSCDIYVDRH